MINWEISAGAILTALLCVWLGHRLSANRAERELYKQKARAFKELLVPFLQLLESTDANPGLLVVEAFPGHDEAARKLVVYMTTKKKRIFLNCWESYAALYREKQTQGITVLLATEVDDISKASPNVPNAVEYVYNQTKKRRNKVRTLIQKALDVL